MEIKQIPAKISITRQYSDLRAPTSSSCGGLVALIAVLAQSKNSCKQKQQKIGPPFFIGGPPYTYPPCRHPPPPYQGCITKSLSERETSGHSLGFPARI